MKKSNLPYGNRDAFAPWKNRFRKMKLTLTLVLVTAMQIFATSTYSQTTRLNLEKTNATVEDVLSTIENQSEFYFLYNGKLIDVTRRVNLNIRNQQVENVLDELFAGTGVVYQVFDRQIVLSPEEIHLSQAQSNTTTIKGSVLSTKSEPLPGVTVVVKGSTLGTTTDIDGNYSISNVPIGATLQFSYIGMVSQEVKTEGKTTINVIMAEDAIGVEEVVVIGYGTVKKRDLTGSVVSMKSDDVVAVPTSNVMEALQGKVVGMDIVKSSGRVGSGVNITVRGNRSIYGDNSPLFIIDGLAGSYESLNPADIESIDVLKDASSTAIYGSAGANGVVIITTKKAKEGKVMVNFDSYVGIDGYAKFPHGMTGDEYVTLKKEAYRGQNGVYPEFMNNIIISQEQYAAYEAGKWIDYIDNLFRTGVEQNYSLSVSHGAEKTKSYFSLNYNDDEGLLRNENRKRYVARANIDQEVYKWLKTGFNIQMTYSNTNNRAQNVFGNALTAVPLGDLYDEQGNLKFTPVSGVTNPLADEIPRQYVDNTLYSYFVGNAYMEVNPFKGFSFKSLVGTNVTLSRLGKYFGKQSIANVEAGFSVPMALITNNRNDGYKWDNILNYQFVLAQNHSFTLTGITSWSQNKSEMSYAAGSGFALDSYAFHNLNGATAQQTVRSSFTGTQTMSYAARLNYSFRGKYLLTLSNRWDGVSWLSEGHKWDSFPAAAVAWRISDEEFMKGVSTIDNLKLRVGYGVTGNSGGVSAYSTTSGGFDAPKPVGFGDVAAPTYIYNQSMGNTALGWEKSYNTNIGIDAGLLDNRLNLTLELYNTDTRDVLYNRVMPASMGGSWGSPFKMWQNIGATNNRGIEIAINTLNIDKKNFKWNSTITFSANREQITSLPGGKDLIADALFLNEAIKTFYNYKYLGIWQENEADEAAKYNCVPGDIKLQTDGNFDTNGKHAYSATTDRFKLGAAVPDWVGGFQNSLSFYGVDVNVFVMARWGQMIQNEVITRYNPLLNTANSPSGVDYWTPENPDAYLPRPGIHSSTGGYIGFDALKFVDGSFIKVKNATIGYTLPSKWMNQIKVSKLRIYATAHNPFIYVHSKYIQDQDPERGGADNFPLTRQFVFGMNLTF